MRNLEKRDIKLVVGYARCATMISAAVFSGRHPHPLSLSDAANPIGHPSHHISIRYLGIKKILLTSPLAFSGHRILLIFSGFTVCCPSIFVGGSSSLLQPLTLGVPGHWGPSSPLFTAHTRSEASSSSPLC